MASLGSARLGAAATLLSDVAELVAPHIRGFDLETEKKRPSWGDPTWRRLRADVTAETIQAHHLHIDTKYLYEDLDVCFPVPLLHEFVSEGAAAVA